MRERGNKAFTLAEVLITLVIIGVIGALTVPSLIQSTRKQEYVTGLKKAYSVLSNAVQQIISEEGSPKCSDGGWACGFSSGKPYFAEYFKNHINIIKDCGTGAGCNSHGIDNRSDLYKVIFADGMYAWFSPGAENCSTSAYGLRNLCASIQVDVNGAKGPNEWGRDLFSFGLKENGLYPAGCDDTMNYKCGDAGASNASCACQVIRENAMNY